METNPLKNLYNDFMLIIDDSVVKYRNIAETYETLDMKKRADEYIKAYRNEDTFFTYYKYPIEILREVIGNRDEALLDSYHLNRHAIPPRYRNQLLLMMRKYVIDNYVEKNSYYRALSGLPDYGDDESSFVYNDISYNQEIGLTEPKPIHMLTDNQLAILVKYGEIDRLCKKYPSKTYLKFLGTKKIDIITARTAKNFSLLRISYDISDTLRNSFTSIYEQCREYFMSCIYITEYRNIIDYYDNFIAMCIMVMTMQQVIARSPKYVIDRNFFDDRSVINLFNLYGVPYNSDMDSNTRNQIVQNLNLLVQNKGTNKVIYDIASILGYDRLKVYKYYLIKAQKFDYKGFPITKYKTNEATGEQELDYKAMFDIYFQRVSIDDMDTYKSLLDVSDKIPYTEITSDDPYWIDDAELQQELYTTEYNYVETKYMGVSISYKLTNILFENIYLLKMLLEKKDEIPYITLDLPKIAPYTMVSIFDAVVMLCALTCKQNKLKGEILTSPSKILHVIGFNFGQDFESIRNDILNNKYLDNSLAKYFEDGTCHTVSRVNKLYLNYKSLYNDLVDMMSITNDINVYDAYKKLFNTIFYTEENQKMFNVGTAENPVYASTFLEYLEKTNVDIFNFINELEDNKIYVYVNHIISKIMTIIPDLKYLGFFCDSSSSMEAMLVELIRFFKSYTTDMLGMDMLLILDLKPESMVKLITRLNMKKYNYTEDSYSISYGDIIDTFRANTCETDMYKLIDKIDTSTTINTIFDTSNLFNLIKIHKLDKRIEPHEFNTILDTIQSNMTMLQPSEIQRLLDEFRTVVSSTVSDTSNLFKFDTINKIITVKHVDYNSLLDYLIFTKYVDVKVKQIFKDVINVYRKVHSKEQIDIIAKMLCDKNMRINETCTAYDIVNILTQCILDDDGFRLHDGYSIKTID